jgi:peroxiredoxin
MLPKIFRSSDWIVLGLLAASLALNVYLGVRLTSVVGNIPSPVRIGEELPPLSGKGPQGTPVTVDYESSSRPTVLYIFTPACKWCTENYQQIRTLIRLKSPEYRFIAVSLQRDGLEEYMRQYPLDVELLYDIPDALAARYGLGPVPQTLVISPKRTLLASWIGTYAEPRVAGIERFFAFNFDDTPPARALASTTPTSPEVKQTSAVVDRGSSKTGRPTCKDEAGLEYSVGRKKQLKGVQMECGADGRWTPVASRSR